MRTKLTKVDQLWSGALISVSFQKKSPSRGPVRVRCQDPAHGFSTSLSRHHLAEQNHNTQAVTGHAHSWILHRRTSPRGSVRVRTRLVSRIGSVVWVSASFHIYALRMLLWNTCWHCRHSSINPTVYGRIAPLTFRPFTGCFVTWTFCPQDVSPPRHFATRTFRPLTGRFAPDCGRFALVSGLFAPTCKL